MSHLPSTSSSIYDANNPHPVIPPRLQRSKALRHSLPSASSNSAPPSPYLARSPAHDTMELKDHSLFSVPHHPSRPHRLSYVSVSSPQRCSVCSDYVITPRCSAIYCSHCHRIFHKACSNLSQNITCVRVETPPNFPIPSDPELLTSNTTNSQLSSAISSSEQPLNVWNRYQVAYWLTVVGLSRFVILFLRSKFDGQQLIGLVPFSSKLDDVIDPFARQALRRAILRLKGSQPCPGENISPSSTTSLPRMRKSGEPTYYNAGVDHDLHMATFMQEVACVVCKLPLLGLMRQGFQCYRCGMIFHRICKSLIALLPTCSGTLVDLGEENGVSLCNQVVETLDYEHLPTRLRPYQSEYFGCRLEDQPRDELTDVPSFLLACTTRIEHMVTAEEVRTTQSPPTNLFSAYQQSASTLRIVTMHATYAHHCPPVDNSDNLDLVRSTQLLKAYLRSLPSPVIPETCYTAFCSLASSTDTSSDHQPCVKSFLDELPYMHRICLFHVMRHLNFVHNHQRRFMRHRSSLPAHTRHDPLVSVPKIILLVFRQLLICPPWDMLIDLTSGLNVHLDALLQLLNMFADPTRLSVIRQSLPANLMAKSSENQYTYRHAEDNTNIEDDYDTHGKSNSEMEEHETMSNAISPVDLSKGPTIDTPPCVMAKSENDADLATRDWYWGDVSQAEVREIMAGLPDGHFLVRDASDASAGVYTLVIRFAGENKLLRIYHRGSYFSVCDPPPPVFRKVSDIIEFYRCHPILAVGDLKLKPISYRNYQFSSSGPGPHGDNTSSDASQLIKTQLLAELKKTMVEIVAHDDKIQRLTVAGQKVMVVRDEAAKFVKGYEKLQGWFQLQVDRLKENMESVEDEHQRRFIVKQQDHISEKLQETNQKVECYRDLFSEKSSEYADGIEMQVLYSERCRELKRCLPEIRRTLRFHGVNVDDRLSTISTGTSSSRDGCETPNPELEYSLPSEISDKSTWYFTNMARGNAEEVLADKPLGTFLIRCTEDIGRLALSVRLVDSVQHCLIHQANGRYGFIADQCTFENLEGLVCHYHTHSLKQHNPLLDTTLRYPANAALF